MRIFTVELYGEVTDITHTPYFLLQFDGSVCLVQNKTSQ